MKNSYILIATKYIKDTKGEDKINGNDNKEK